MPVTNKNVWILFFFFPWCKNNFKLRSFMQNHNAFDQTQYIWINFIEIENACIRYCGWLHWQMTRNRLEARYLSVIIWKLLFLPPETTVFDLSHSNAFRQRDSDCYCGYYSQRFTDAYQSCSRNSCPRTKTKTYSDRAENYMSTRKCTRKYSWSKLSSLPYVKQKVFQNCSETNRKWHKHLARNLYKNAHLPFLAIVPINTIEECNRIYTHDQKLSGTSKLENCVKSSGNATCVRDYVCTLWIMCIHA